MKAILEKRLFIVIMICLVLMSGIFNVYANSETRRLEVIRAIAWNSDGSLYAVGGGPLQCSNTNWDTHSVLVFDATTHSVVQTLLGNDCYVTSIVWTNNDTNIITSNAKAIIFAWDLEGNMLDSIAIAPNAGSAQSLDWQATTDTIVASNRIQIAIIDAMSPPSAKWIGSSVAMGSVKWDPFTTDRVITGDYEGRVQRWDITTETVLGTIIQHNSQIIDLEINGQYLAAASNQGEISIIDLSDDSITNTILVTSMSVFGLREIVWKPDGSQIAVAFDNIVEIYDTTTGDLVDQIVSDGQVYTVSWSPDGTQLLYGGNSPTSNLVSIPTPTRNCEH